MPNHKEKIRAMRQWRNNYSAREFFARRRFWRRKLLFLRFMLEYYCFLKPAHGGLQWLPYSFVGWLCGSCLGSLGPRLFASKRIADNLDYIWPDLPADRRKYIIKSTWENFGQVAADYVKLDCLESPGRLDIRGEEILQQLAQEGKGVLFFSAHLSSWEPIRYAARHKGIGMNVVYRAFNNPFFDRMAWERMVSRYDYPYHRNDKQALRHIISDLRAGKWVLLLVDQYVSRGLACTLLGKKAPTAAGLARLALATGVKVIPAYVVRRQIGQFQVTFEPPLLLEGLRGDQKEKSQQIMQMANDRLSAWISAHPEQWFWLHRRWPAIRSWSARKGDHAQNKHPKPGDKTGSGDAHSGR